MQLRSLPRVLSGYFRHVALTKHVDIDARFKPTIVADILCWDFSMYPSGFFHTIWSSPPCTEYSRALTTRKRNLKLADRVVQKTLEIIKYFNPVRWYLENPRWGLLKDRRFMREIPFVDLEQISVARLNTFFQRHRKSVKIISPLIYFLTHVLKNKFVKPK